MIAACILSTKQQVFASHGWLEPSLQWRHNGHGGIPNHQRPDCLLNCLFRLRSKKTERDPDTMTYDTMFPTNVLRLMLRFVLVLSYRQHYSDVIMIAMASQITSITIVHSTVFFQAQIKENIKTPCHWPLWEGFTGYRWIICTKGQ